MNIEELKNMFDEKDLSFEDVEKIIDNKNFSEAAKLGVDYAKSQKFVNFEDAPFCIDKIDAVPIQIVIADSVKKLIDDMKKSAIVQSDTAEKKGDNYEASFCLYGQKKGEKIIQQCYIFL